MTRPSVGMRAGRSANRRSPHILHRDHSIVFLLNHGTLNEVHSRPGIAVMGWGDRRWSEPKRSRTAIRQGTVHLGYATTVSYPNRDLTAFPAGTPYFEVVVSDLAERHVVLLQRFKQHWLIHCGNQYDVVDVPVGLSARDVESLALFAIEHESDGAEWLLAELKSQFLARVRSGDSNRGQAT